jgi:hypothetical protein
VTAPLPEEAARLVAAVQDWAARTLPADDGCTCTWCPVCQGLAVLRGDRPDVTERLTDAMATAATALATIAAALARPAPAPPADPDPGPAPAPEPVVQHIHLD